MSILILFLEHMWNSDDFRQNKKVSKSSVGLGTPAIGLCLTSKTEQSLSGFAQFPMRGMKGFLGSSKIFPNRLRWYVGFFQCNSNRYQLFLINLLNEGIISKRVHDVNTNLNEDRVGDESGEVEPGDEHNLLWCDALGRVIVDDDLRELYMKEGVTPKLSVFPYSLPFSYRFAKMFCSAL